MREAGVQRDGDLPEVTRESRVPVGNGTWVSNPRPAPNPWPILALWRGLI